MVCNLGYVSAAVLQTGVYAAAGAVFAAVTAGPVGVTAVAFALSIVAERILVAIAAQIGVSYKSKSLTIALIIGTSAVITTISILAMHALAIIATTGAIVLAVFSACTILVGGSYFALQMKKQEPSLWVNR